MFESDVCNHEICWTFLKSFFNNWSIEISKKLVYLQENNKCYSYVPNKYTLHFSVIKCFENRLNCTTKNRTWGKWIENRLEIEGVGNWNHLKKITSGVFFSNLRRLISCKFNKLDFHHKTNLSLVSDQSTTLHYFNPRKFVRIKTSLWPYFFWYFLWYLHFSE